MSHCPLTKGPPAAQLCFQMSSDWPELANIPMIHIFIYLLGALPPWETECC